MGKVVAMFGVSLDGYFEGPGHDISWHQVDEEFHGYVNEVLAATATFVSGRRTHDGMVEFWPNADADPANAGAVAEFAAIWRDKPKIVYSRHLQEAGWNTEIWREIDVAQVEALRARGDVALGGGELAAGFRELDLIDAYRLYVQPVLLGAGTLLFRPDEPRQPLRLVETHTFGNGVVLLHYERDRS